LVGGALLAGVAVCVGQAPPSVQTNDGHSNLSSGQAPAPSADYLRASEPPQSQVATPPKEKSIEELLARLDAIKAQKEELEKARTETVALVKEKLKQQKQRLQKLGVSVEEVSVPPPSVSTTSGQVGDPLIGAAAGAYLAPKAESPGRNSEKR
jgi:hypothetical protein